VKNYIFTFAKHVAIDRLRHRKVRDKYLSYASYSQNSSDTAPDEMLIIKEKERALEAAIEDMPPKQREIFVLSMYDSMTDDELAKKFGISKRTVQTHLYNASKHVKEYLKRH